METDGLPSSELGGGKSLRPFLREKKPSRKPKWPGAHFLCTVEEEE